MRKIFRKTNISNPLIRARTVRIRGLEMLVFRNILCTYLMDDPLAKGLKTLTLVPPFLHRISRM